MQTLHHVGYVVKSIEEQAPGFVKSLGATWDQQIIHDPLQGAKVTFLRTPGAGDAQIELVEPAGDNSPVSPFSGKGRRIASPLLRGRRSCRTSEDNSSGGVRCGSRTYASSGFSAALDRLGLDAGKTLAGISGSGKDLIEA